MKKPAVSLRKALAETGLDRVDWFKTDSQGTDLRLFKSLDEEMQRRVLCAEFEPGLLDAYEGEDKVHHVLAYMESLPFWLSDLRVCGARRLRSSTLAREFAPEFRRRVVEAQRISPGWAEMTFLNDFQPASRWGRREFLLGWIFSTLESQHGFALELARTGQDLFVEEIFGEMAETSRESLMGPVSRPDQVRERALIELYAALGGGRVYIFGTGRAGRAARRSLPVPVLGFLDNNVDVHGTMVEELPVLNPDVLREEDKTNLRVIVGSMHFSEIAGQLRRIGLEEGLHFFDGASLFRSVMEPQ